MNRIPLVDISHIKVEGLRCSSKCDCTEYFIGTSTEHVSATKVKKLKLMVCIKCGRQFITKRRTLIK